MTNGRTALFRGVLRRLGTVLIALGVLALVWTFVIWKWNDPVTGVYTWYEQRQLSAEYAHHLKQAVATLPRVRQVSTVAEERRQIRRAAGLYRAESTEGEPIGRIIVPRLGLNMVLVNGTDDASLRRGPGRATETYMPGQGQLVYIAGHRTTFLAPFAQIENLRPGDTITLSVPYGTFAYRVYAHVIVPANDLARLKSHGREVVALQACHPRFFATQRYIVYGRLIRVVPTSGKPFTLPS